MENELSQLLDALSESSGTAIPDEHVDFARKRWRESTNPGVADACYQGWKTMIQPEDLPHLPGGRHSTAPSGKMIDPSARLRHRDGDYRWLPSRPNASASASDRAGKWRHAPGRSNKPAALSIIEGVPVPVVVTTPSGDICKLNQPAIDYFGSSFDEFKGLKVADTVHPDDLPYIVAAQSKALKTGATYNVQSRHRRADGIYRWFNVIGMPLRGTQGAIVCWIHFQIDIDDGRRAEEALRTVERDLSSIINMIPALAWSARADGSAECFNRHYLDYIGLSAEQACGWGWTVAVHPDDAGELIASWTRIIQVQKPGETEARLRRFDGKYCWFLFRVNPLRNEAGAIVKWCGINIDIDDRKRAEEKLRRSEAFLAEGQRTGLAGSFSWLLDTNELTFSEELYRIFEFEPGTPVTLERIADRVHPDDIPLLFDKRADARSTGSDHDYEMRLLLPDGAIKYVHVVSHSTRGRDDRPEYIGAVQDVTQRRVSEETLGGLRSELARMAKINSFGALTASIAHEVNQPLSGVITNASTCLRMLAADPPNIDGARETARRTIRDGHRASDVITRVRALFGKKTLVAEWVNLNEATKEVIALSQNTLRRGRVILKTVLCDDLPTVRGDRVQLQQVILNLLLNAVQAMKDVDDRPRKLVISTEKDPDDHVRLTVRDSGTGFGPDGMDKLFEAFYTTKGGGMGIGLSISQSIIERHHGRLQAAPNNGPGATFWFSVPRLIAGIGEDGRPATEVRHSTTHAVANP